MGTASDTIRYYAMMGAEKWNDVVRSICKDRLRGGRSKQKMTLAKRDIKHYQPFHRII
jgi:hypothetical protein